MKTDKHGPKKGNVESRKDPQKEFMPQLACEKQKDRVKSLGNSFLQPSSPCFVFRVSVCLQYILPSKERKGLEREWIPK